MAKQKHFLFLSELVCVRRGSQKRSAVIVIETRKSAYAVMKSPDQTMVPTGVDAVVIFSSLMESLQCEETFGQTVETSCADSVMEISHGERVNSVGP